MTVSKPYLTLFTNLALAIFSLIIAYKTNLIIIVPILFVLGFPLINIDKPIKQKLGLIFVIILTSTVIFVEAVSAMFFFSFDKFISPALFAGLAGAGFWGINGLLIESARLNIKTITIVFLLSALSWPIWIILTENIFSKTFTNVEVKQSVAMLFWMALTTIGMCLSINLSKKR